MWRSAADYSAQQFRAKWRKQLAVQWQEIRASLLAELQLGRQFLCKEWEARLTRGAGAAFLR
jgi:hypothetical protein